MMHSHVFVGQCWSLLGESDAMWRTYSQDKKGVKVKTTIRKLLNSLLDNAKSAAAFENHQFIGKVEYLNKDLIVEKFRLNVKRFLTEDKGMAETHFYKRMEFSHEKEVRLLFKTFENVDNKGWYQLKIDPNFLIDEIVLDPRLEAEQFEKTKGILQTLDFHKPIYKSNLYEFEDIKLDIDLQNW